MWHRFLAWYFDLSPASVGEGISWRLDAGPSVGANASFSTFAMLAGLIVAVTILVSWREAATTGWRRQACLIGLRLAVATVLLAMLARVSLRIDRVELPAVAVLVDTSASMSLSDQYLDRRHAAAARQVSRESGARSPSRLETTRTILTRRDGEWWRRLSKTHRVRLYHFDEHLRIDRPPEEDSGPAEPEETFRAIREWEAEGAPTAPGTALTELLEQSRGDNLAAVVLFTDGVASAGEGTRLSRAAPRAREVGVPLYPIAVGSRDPVRDLELFDLLGEEVVLLGDPVTLTLQVRHSGYSGRTVQLEVAAEGRPAPLAVREVELGADGAAEEIELTVDLTDEGEHLLEVRARPLPNEADAANNIVRHGVEVRSERLKILLVEGYPRWEYRVLKPALERDDAFELDTFLQSVDLDYVAEDETALRGFPLTQHDLNRYDVIVWGDVDLTALPHDVPQQLRRFVSEFRGGLILIAGERDNPLQYGGTDLEVLLPVSLLEAQAVAVGIDPAPARLRVTRTPEGAARRFMRLEDDPQEDQAAWQSLPEETDWFVHTPQVKPGGIVLAKGPLSNAGSTTAPLTVHHRLGRGQVLYHGFDSTWTWRKGVEDRYFGRYWSQAIRALAADRLRQDASGRRLASDRTFYEPGDNVRLKLQSPLRENESSPDTVDVIIESTTGEPWEATLEPQSTQPGVWVGVIRDLPTGRYGARLAGTGPDAAAVSCTFEVRSPDRELRDRKADLADLEQAARMSHGKFHTFADADGVPSAIPRGRTTRRTQSEPIPLWNRWEAISLVVLLLSAEWLLRRRSRLV